MGVNPPNQHLIAPIAGALNDLRIMALIAGRLRAEVTKRMRTRTPQFQPQRIRRRFHRIQRNPQRRHRLRHRVAHRRHQLHRVREKLPLQMNLGMLGLHQSHHIGGTGNQVAGARINQGHLPFHPKGRLRGGVKLLHKNLIFN